MTKEITFKELLELVTVTQISDGSWRTNSSWRIVDVEGNVYDNVRVNVGGDVEGNEELLEAFNQLKDK